MKKLTLILAILTVLTVLALPAAAVEAGKNLGELPQTTEKITIDGKKDAIYDQGLKFDTTLMKDAAQTNPATSKVYVLWDGKKTFYVFAEITDKTMSEWVEATYKASPWTLDSMEVFFDFANDAKKRDQYRIDNAGKPTYYDSKTYYEDLNKYGFDAWGFQKTSNGYNVEFQISSYATALKAGGQVGFDMLLNDMVDGTRKGSYFASSLESKGTVAKFDYITLGTKVVTVPVVTTKAAATTAAKAAATASAKTADVSVIVAAVAAAAIAGVVVCRKKH